MRAAGTDAGTSRRTGAPTAEAEPPVAEEGADDEDAGPPDERNPPQFGATSSSAPIVTGLSRRLKRALQDSQNDLLDKLRAKGSTWSPDLLPDETEQVDSLCHRGACPLLEEAADAGVSFAGIRRSDRPKTDAWSGIAHELAESSSVRSAGASGRRRGPGRAEESVVTEHVGSAFREWKGERIERLAGDHVVAAFSLGTLAAAGSTGVEVEWVAVAGFGRGAVPRLRGQRAERRPGRGRGVPDRARAIHRPTRAVDASSHAQHPLGCLPCAHRVTCPRRPAVDGPPGAVGSSSSSIVLVILFASLHTFAVFYTDALWFSSVNLHSVWLKLFEIKVGLLAGLQRHLRRPAPGQPDGGRAHSPRRARRSTPRTSSSSATAR